MKAIVGCIYKITNIINGKCYIGQTTQNVKRRFNAHFINAYSSKVTNYKFPQAIRKYGKDAFILEVIVSNVPVELLNDLETSIIHMEDSYINGYNTLAVGGNFTGYKRSKESRKAQSDRMLGERNPFYNKSHSADTISILKACALSREAKRKGLKDGLLNPTARKANIYNYYTNELIAKDICITEWCKDTIYHGRNLRQTAQTRADIQYKYPVKHHKGIYAIYLN